MEQMFLSMADYRGMPNSAEDCIDARKRTLRKTLKPRSIIAGVESRVSK